MKARTIHEGGGMRDFTKSPLMNLTGDRIALLNPLRNHAGDVRAAAASLRRAAFEVMERFDLNRAGMPEALRFLSDAPAPGDAAFLYSAGHGLQFRKENFLMPTDIPAGLREFEAEDSLIKVNTVLRALAQRQSGDGNRDTWDDNIKRGTGRGSPKTVPPSHPMRHLPMTPR